MGTTRGVNSFGFSRTVESAPDTSEDKVLYPPINPISGGQHCLASMDSDLEAFSRNPTASLHGHIHWVLGKFCPRLPVFGWTAGLCDHFLAFQAIFCPRLPVFGLVCQSFVVLSIGFWETFAQRCRFPGCPGWPA